MTLNDMDDTYADALEHVRYLRGTGVSAGDAAASVGWYPTCPIGWDDVVFRMARALHLLRWGGMSA
jgi:hypothetical protein